MEHDSFYSGGEALDSMVTHQERRKDLRIPMHVGMRVYGADTQSGEFQNRPAVLHNLSRLGAALTTPLSLRQGQWFDLLISTEGCPEDVGIPKQLVGRACVRRVERHDGHTCDVGVRLGPSLSRNTQFLRYLKMLQQMEMPTGMV